jgi:hypothetical protein
MARLLLIGGVVNAPLFIKEGLGEICMPGKMLHYQNVICHSKSPSIPLFQRGKLFFNFCDTLYRGGVGSERYLYNYPSRLNLYLNTTKNNKKPKKQVKYSDNID